MKTTMKAALLLLSGTIFFSQASWAAKPTGDCAFPDGGSQYGDITLALETIYADLAAAYHADQFTSKKKDQNYFGLRCKVVSSELKLQQEKPGDAAKSLLDSAMKVQTLGGQSKLEIDAADDLYAQFMAAWELAAAAAL
jgi:hypothetical protein